MLYLEGWLSSFIFVAYYGKEYKCLVTRPQNLPWHNKLDFMDKFMYGQKCHILPFSQSLIKDKPKPAWLRSWDQLERLHYFYCGISFYWRATALQTTTTFLLVTLAFLACFNYHHNTTHDITVLNIPEVWNHSYCSSVSQTNLRCIPNSGHQWKMYTMNNCRAHS